MALGKTNRVDGKAFSLKLATKRDGAFLDRPEWEVSAKQPDGEYKTYKNSELLDAIGVEGPLYDVAGDLIGLDTRIGEYEGSPIYNATLSLRDANRNEVYFTGFSVGSMLGRKLASSMLNLQAFDNVQVGLYNQINKETKKSYAAAALRQGDNTATIKSKFDFKTEANLQPRLFEGKGGKQEKDWSKPDLWLFEQLKAFGEVVKANKANLLKPSRQDAPSLNSNDEAPEAPQVEKGSDEDMPF